MRLIGVAEISGHLGERYRTGPIAKAGGRLVQTTPLDQPLRRQPDPATYQPLQCPLGEIELLADLRNPNHVRMLFDELDSQNRYAILFRIHDAKKTETRAARIEKYVGMLARGETPYPRRKAR